MTKQDHYEKGESISFTQCPAFRSKNVGPNHDNQSSGCLRIRCRDLDRHRECRFQRNVATITGGANTSSPLSFGSDGSGVGQYIVGTFVANSSGGQTLILNASSTGSGPSPQINLFQVRDITPVITSIAVSGPTLTITATNGPSNGEFVLLQSTSVTVPVSQWAPVLTNSFDGSGNLTLSTNVVNPGNLQAFYALRMQ